MLKPKEARDYLESLNCSKSDRQVRLLSFLSAAMAVCRNELTQEILAYLKDHASGRQAVYETILQSYLFLGFPRMIEASLVFNKVFGNARQSEQEIKKYSTAEANDWFKKGSDLCRKVYGRNYRLLERRFLEVSPEIFRWMVIEGYGKVLNRPGMTQIERELAEVAALIVDRRERQLLSHVIGSLNVGANINLIRTVNMDIRPLSGEKAFKMADKIISEIENKNETQK